MVGRRIAFLLIVAAVLPAGGCGAIGWTRALGHFPGVAPTDYAFYDYFGTQSQLYQFSVPQVQGATLQALGDLGFKVAGPPKVTQEGEVAIEARTPDGRPAEISITPQNNLSNLRVKIGPVCVGDSSLSRDLFKRVALNFGTLPRSYTPLEPTLSKRQNHVLVNPDPYTSERYETLLGEGLRPGETRGTVEGEQNNPGSMIAPTPVMPLNASPYFAPSPFLQPFDNFP